MALFRALETAKPPAVRLCEDRFAQAFLPPGLCLVAVCAKLQFAGRWIRGYIDQRWPGVRTSAVARTRYIDAAIATAVAGGCRQVVILGAGFDARAYRLECLAGLQIFEVDHPATSAVKRARIAKVLGSPPLQVRFVTVDFNTQQLASVMHAAGYDANTPTVFVWEGVTNYLHAAAVAATLRWFAVAAAGSKVVFTFIERRVLDEPEAFHGTEQVLPVLMAASERWTFGIHPPELEAYLAQHGLVLEEQCGAPEYRLRYYGTVARGMRGYEFYRVAVARVAE